MPLPEHRNARCWRYQDNKAFRPDHRDDEILQQPNPSASASAILRISAGRMRRAVVHSLRG